MRRNAYDEAKGMASKAWAKLSIRVTAGLSWTWWAVFLSLAFALLSMAAFAVVRYLLQSA